MDGQGTLTGRHRPERREIMPKVVLGVTMYNIKEVAELLSVTTKTIQNYIRADRIQGQKIGGRWYFTEEMLKAFLQGHTEPASY
jgi:excisionase family DNA binding protein